MRVPIQELRNQISLAAVASRSVKLRRAGKEWKACCPFHADRTPSFTIYADDSRFMCFGCGAEGDVIDFIRRLHGTTLRGALELLGAGGEALSTTRSHSLPQRVRSDEAANLWNGAGAIQGTLAEVYLSSRGITCSLPLCLRFAMLPLRDQRLPTLVAAVSSLDGQVQGIQRTFLKSDGSGKAHLPGGKSKLSLGRVRSGAIRLAAPADELVLTEGLEDGLTVHQLTGMPVWVAAGATMLPHVELPTLVKRVVIAADNDPAGMASAEMAANRYSQDRSVRLIRPDPSYKDFNEQLQDRGW